MNTCTFEVVDLPPIEPLRGVVTQWRKSKGEVTRVGHTARYLRKHRLAWSPSEAADLAGISVRTVHDWRKSGFIVPTFDDPEAGVVEARYCAADVFALRMAMDLREFGLPKPLVDLVVSSHAEVFGWHNAWQPARSFGALVADDPVWLVPTTEEDARLLHDTYHQCLVLAGDIADPATWSPGGHEDDLAHVLVKHPHIALAEYPARRRVDELGERAAAWWRVARTPEKERPSWMQ